MREADVDAVSDERVARSVAVVLGDTDERVLAAVADADSDERVTGSDSDGVSDDDALPRVRAAVSDDVRESGALALAVPLRWPLGDSDERVTGSDFVSVRCDSVSVWPAVGVTLPLRCALNDERVAVPTNKSILSKTRMLDTPYLVMKTVPFGMNCTALSCVHEPPLTLGGMLYVMSVLTMSRLDLCRREYVIAPVLKVEIKMS